MKKWHLLPMLFAATAGHAQDINFKIEGALAVNSPYPKAYLMYTGDQGRVFDSAAIQNGKFTFTGKHNAPARASLFTGYSLEQAYNRNYCTFYIENGNISVTSKDSILNAAVKGGKANNDFQAYQTIKATMDEKGSAIRRAFFALPAEEKQTDAAKAANKAKHAAVDLERQQAVAAFVKGNNNSMVSLDAVIDWAGYDPDAAKVEPVFHLLTSGIREMPAAKAFQKRLHIARKTAIGAEAPLFTQNDTLGKPLALATFKGKYVLIDFWASWCGPCRAENPHVVKAFNAYKGKNFTVLGVSLDGGDKGRELWLKAIHDDGLTWPQVSSLNGWQNEAAQLYGVQGVPANFLVGPDGKIVAKNLRGANLEAKLKELLP